MSIDMFPDGAVDYLLRHAKCDKAIDHGLQCPDQAVDPLIETLHAEVVRLKKEVNDLDASLYEARGTGGYKTPYPEVEDV